MDALTDETVNIHNVNHSATKKKLYYFPLFYFQNVALINKKMTLYFSLSTYAVLSDAGTAMHRFFNHAHSLQYRVFLRSNKSSFAVVNSRLMCRYRMYVAVIYYGEGSRNYSVNRKGWKSPVKYTSHRVIFLFYVCFLLCEQQTGGSNQQSVCH